MQKIAGPGSTPTQEFTEGSPSSSPPTTVTAAWLNTMQRELVAIVEASGQALNPANDAQVLAALQIIAGGGGGGSSRNMLANAGFEIWQRLLAVGSFGITNAGAYTADRWHARSDQLGSGAGTATITKQAFALGQTDVPGDPKNYMRWAQSVASTQSNPALAQRVEDVTRFGAGALTFSAYLKGSGSLAATLRIFQVFGTGGSPSASVLVATQGVSLTTGWQRFSTSVNLTAAGFAMAGKTLGTAGNSYLLCEILLPNGTSGWTVEIANAQLERNSQVSAFSPRDPGEDLRICQRYFQRTGSLTQPQDQLSPIIGGLFHMSANSGNGGVLDFSILFQVPMRAIPTMTWRNPQDAVLGTINWGGSKSVTSTVNGSELVSGYPIVASPPAPGTPTLAYCHYNADAEI